MAGEDPVDAHAVLVADADRWRHRLPTAPDITLVFDRIVEAHPVSASGRQRAIRWRRIGLWASVAAVVLIVAGYMYVDRGTSGRIPGAPAAVVSDGHRVLYAGPVPWNAPITDPSDPRTVYVFADNDNADARVCDITVDRAIVVHQDSRSVSVAVAGYTPADHHGPWCDFVGHTPVPVAVHLAAPLDGRKMIDAHDGESHAVLDATTVPAIHYLPTRCGTTALTWNPATSIATRSTTGPAQSSCRVIMTYGPTASMNRQDPPDGARQLDVDIHGHTASLYTLHFKVGTDSATLQWAPDPGHLLRLFVNAPPSDPLPLAAILTAARSIH